MRIAGLVGSSLLDFPDRISCVLFLQGCNWNCWYCHNPQLISLDSDESDPYTLETFREFLGRRKGRLDGVVVTGGEPTIHRDLPNLLAMIKGMGYAVKLDTNGSNPQMVKDILDANLVDYIALDIKAPWDKYALICGDGVRVEYVKQTLALLKGCAIGWEARTTVCPSLNGEDLKKMEGVAKG
jgi:pyruvate formate lyase activating enzyme